MPIRSRRRRNSTPCLQTATFPTDDEQVERANASGRTPVVFVHGLWLLPSSWDRWADVFEEAGYTSLTPGWPDDPDTVEEANAHPEVFAHKTVGQVADHFARRHRQADEEAGRDRPLVRRPPRRRSSPVAGSRRPPSRSTRHRSAACCRCRSRRSRPRRPCSATRRTTTAPCRSRTSSSATRFANAVSEDEAKELYETYAVPAPGAPLFQAATANLNPWTEVEGRHRRIPTAARC